MKKLACLIALAGALGLSFSSQAQIIVNAVGSGTLTFTVPPHPVPVEEWSTMTIAGSDSANTPSAILDAVQAQVSVAGTAALRTSSSEAPGQQQTAIHSSFNGGYLVTRPTSTLGVALMAKLQNGTANNFDSLEITYSLRRIGTARSETVVAHEVYYSFTGEIGSWVNIPELSGGPTTATTVTKQFEVTFSSAWLAGQSLYILWVDDNEAGGTDDTWIIDNLSFIPPGAPMTLALNTPANNLLLAGSPLNPASTAVTVTPSGENEPTSVSFYANDVLFATDTTAPFAATLTGLLPNTSVNVYAVASNATEFAYSQTNIVNVRDEFVHFTGNEISENFDSLGTDGTLTPVGWFAGFGVFDTSTPENVMTISVGNGGAPTPAAAWNYGVTGESDRSLGTAPTGTGSPGGDRSIVVRIQNNSGQSIVAIDFLYDGEQWRTYTNGQFGFTNQISLNQGQTWITTGPSFDFLQPTPIADPPGSVPPAAVNGNELDHQLTIIGGSVDLSATPIAPNGVIYIRWFDRNEGGTDGAVSIDNFVFNATLDTFEAGVAIIAPETGSGFPLGGVFTVSALPAMANPVTNVTFYADNFSTVLGADTNAPFSITASNLALGNHTLYVTAQDSSGLKVTNTANVTITINPNVPPSISITNPIAGTEYLVGTLVPNVSVDATDADGGIVQVEFFVNDIPWVTDTNSTYSFDLNNLYPGVNTIKAVAVDTTGVRVTNSISITATNPPGITAIIPNGSQWNYLDTGVDQNTAWQTSTDNTGWLSGFGEFGGGDRGSGGRPDRTEVNLGVSGSRHTVYFRKVINVADLSAFTGLTLGVLADDAAAVYINGVEVFRSALMPAGPVLFGTLATDDAADDGTVYTFTNAMPTSVLNVGQNIIAVEMHQNSLTSSDLSFDLMLLGESGAAGPKLTITRTSPTEVTLSWGADAAGYTLYGGPSVPFSIGAWSAIGGAIGGAGSTVVNTTGTMQFFVLRNP